MTKEEIKPIVNDMINNVIKYMNEALDNDKDFYELSVECTASFMASDININDDMSQLIDNLREKHSDLIDTMFIGILKCRHGEKGYTVL